MNEAVFTDRFDTTYALALESNSDDVSIGLNEAAFWRLEKEGDVQAKMGKQIDATMASLASAIESSDVLRDALSKYERHAARHPAAPKRDDDLDSFLAARHAFRETLGSRKTNQTLRGTDPRRWRHVESGDDPVNVVVFGQMLSVFDVNTARAALRQFARSTRGCTLQWKHFVVGSRTARSKDLGDPPWMDSLEGGSFGVRVACWFEALFKISQAAAEDYFITSLADPGALSDVLESKASPESRKNFLRQIGVDPGLFFEVLNSDAKIRGQDYGPPINDILRGDRSLYRASDLKTVPTVFLNGIAFGGRELEGVAFHQLDLI